MGREGKSGFLVTIRSYLNCINVTPYVLDYYENTADNQELFIFCRVGELLKNMNYPRLNEILTKI